jgi:dTDP-4-amino-4,6-dideoxygalactose transaminase
VTSERIREVALDNSGIFEALLPRLRDLVARGAFILGPELAEFEAAAAAAFGCSWAVGTSSGTSALALALQAALIPRGAKVAIPANTFFATAEAVVHAGHVPVVIDHDEDDLLDLDALKDLEISAVIAVHLHGLPVDMDRLGRLAAERDWWVLEDAAQAHGASVSGHPVGSLGDAAAFSAYPTKNLGAWGDAGFVTGNDEELGERIRALRHHGQSRANQHELIGGTDRLDNLQALVLTEKLRRLPAEVERRREVATWYAEDLADSGLLLPGDRGNRRHAFHHYAVRVSQREHFRAWLSEAGIDTGVHYPAPVHLQPGLVGRCDLAGSLKNAEASSSETVSLPMYPSLTREQVARVTSAVQEFLARRRADLAQGIEGSAAGRLA